MVFPHIRDHVDQIITIPDTELVDAFLDVMEKHKMVVENAGCSPSPLCATSSFRG